VIGGLWAATLITGGWSHSIPTLPRVLFGGALLAIVLTLASVATTRRNYRQTRMALVASATGLVMLDALMVASVLTLGPPPAWPLALAVTGSALRGLNTLCMLPSAMAAR
jgi:hypothetical protein